KDEGRQEMAQNRKQEKGQKPQPTPEQTPGEKKQGDLKSNQGEQQEGSSAGGGSEAEPVEREGEMSAAQANGLLNSLRSEEERVRLMQRQETEDTLKDW
ncbi:MAG: hypothetical protein WBL39_07750, partial [Terrimicrobiaceae bacterium]